MNDAPRVCASGQKPAVSPRVGILFDNFGPYHIARIVGAAQFCHAVALEDVGISGVYDWKRSSLPNDLDYLALRPEGSSAPIKDIFDAKVRPLALDCLALPGWSSRTSLEGLRWCLATNTPAILMSESNAWDFRRTYLKERLKRELVRQFSAALVSSDSQAQYLVQLGMDSSAIFRGYNVVDNSYFSRESAISTSQPMPRVRGLRLPPDIRGKYFLASSRFVPKKNLHRLVSAYGLFRKNRTASPLDWPLVILGDGELRGQIESLVKRLGIAKHVYMPGFCQIEELPRFYGTAGGFIHASTVEQWGLVVNEAMASRLPVAVSHRCGCAEVLITDGETGFLFDPFSEEDIALAFTKLSHAIEDQDLVRRAEERVSAWGPERFGQALADAAQFALRRRTARRRLVNKISLGLGARIA